LAAIQEIGKVDKQKTMTEVMIFDLDESLKNKYLGTVNDLRKAGINFQVYLGNDKSFKAQMNYAVKQEIPFIVLWGEDEEKAGKIKIKDTRTREQVDIEVGNVVSYVKDKI
jgi:histidyl-tRNA synthetase